MSMLVGGAMSDLAFRVAQVALPLVVLQETGSVAATGLVAGCEGLPVLLSPWWARRLRHWVSSGHGLAAVAVLDTVALSVVPVAAGTHRLTPVVLALAGLLLGLGEALGAPGRSALLAEVGDRLGGDRAVTLLTWQDLLRRCGMVVGPGLGGAAVAAGVTYQLLWLQAASVLVAGLLAWPVGGRPGPELVRAPAIRPSLTGRPAVLAGWTIRAAGCFCWFAFTLGLAVLGAQQGRPGVLFAAGMTGYGIGAVIGTAVAVAAVRRFATLSLARLAWSGVGLAWVAMGVCSRPAAVGVFAAGAGASVVIGIAAVTAEITRSSAGAVRRTLLAGQAAVVTASSSAGMLVGGPVLAAVGVRPTLVVTGVLIAAVAVVAPAVVTRGAAGPPGTTVARRSGQPPAAGPPAPGARPAAPSSHR